MERSYGAFRRTFELPAPIDSDAVSAELVAGVLTVTVPKRAPGRTVADRDGRRLIPCPAGSARRNRST